METFMLLDLAKDVIHKKLTSQQACITAQALMKYPPVSFEILDSSYKARTADFEQKENGEWVYKNREAF